MMIGIEKNGIVISIGIGFGKNRFRKKYRYRFRKFLVSKKVSVSVSENFGIEKSIGFGIEKFWYRKKVSVSVSFRFLVSSLTAADSARILMCICVSCTFVHIVPFYLFVFFSFHGHNLWLKFSPHNSA